MSSDVGLHYRREFNGVKLDPYRVCHVYEMNGGPREHMTKKLLRGVDKGGSELELIKELYSCLDRWGEMLQEEHAAAHGRAKKPTAESMKTPQMGETERA